MESKAYCLGFVGFFFFFFLQIRRVRPTLFPLAMTPWHLKNNMTPTTKCCCWLAPSKAVREVREVTPPKAGVEVSQRVGPRHRRASSLRDLYKLGRGKRDGDECPFHPASLKTSRGLPLTAGGGGGGQLCRYFHATFQLGRSHLCGFRTKKGSFFGRASVSIFNHNHHTNSSSQRMRKLSHRLYLTSFGGLQETKKNFLNQQSSRFQ